MKVNKQKVVDKETEHLCLGIENVVKKEIDNSPLKCKIEPSITQHCNTSLLKQEVVEENAEQLTVEHGVKIELVDDWTEELGVETALNEIKKEEDEEKERNRAELYFGHDVKADMLIGPVVLQRSEAQSVSLENSSGIGQATNSGNKLCRRAAAKPPPRRQRNRPPAHPRLCQLCGRECINNHKLLIHMRVHTGEKPYSCDTCGRAFKMKEHLKCHLGVHARAKDISYRCEVCYEEFISKRDLTKHLLYTHR